MPSPKTERIDVVMEASMDSFPASDPPGWIRSAASTCDTPSDDANEAVEAYEDLPTSDLPSATSGPHLRRAKRIVLASVIGLGVAGIAFFLVRRSRRAVA